MKKRWLCFTLACIFLLGSCGKDTTDNYPLGESGESLVDTVEDPLDNSEKFQFQLNEVSYQMPFRVEQLLQNGWSFQDTSLTEKTYAKSFGESEASLVNGAESIVIGFVNYQEDTKIPAQCHVSNITFSNDANVMFAKDITMDSTSQDIIKTYGTPTQSSPEMLVYTIGGEDSNLIGEIQWVIDTESTDKTLKEVTLISYVTPDDIDEPAYLSNPVDYQPSYTPPEALSVDKDLYQIQMQEVVYGLPVPVNTLLSDGWVFRHNVGTVPTDLTTEELKAQLISAENSVDMSNIWMEKNGVVIVVVSGLNQDSIAQPFLNCYVSGISGNASEAVLPSGMTAGSTKEEVVAAYGTEYIEGADNILYTLPNDGYLQLTFQDNLLSSYVYQYAPELNA